MFVFLFLFWLIFLQFFRCLLILRPVVAIALQFSVEHKYRLSLGLSTFWFFSSCSVARSCFFLLVSGELLITAHAANVHDCRVLKKCFLFFIQVLLFYVILKLEHFFKMKTLHWQWLARIMHQCFPVNILTCKELCKLWWNISHSHSTQNKQLRKTNLL